jgi:hypothetical protein
VRADAQAEAPPEKRRGPGIAPRAPLTTTSGFRPTERVIAAALVTTAGPTEHQPLDEIYRRGRNRAMTYRVIA